MEYEERNALGGVISTCAVTGWFGGRLLGQHRDGAFNGSDGVTLWAQSVLWMVPASMAICIGAIILIHVAHAILTATPHQGVLTDERDTAIGRRAMQMTLVVASVGFIAAIAALAAGWSALAGMNIVLAGFVAGDLSGNLFKLAIYRLGL